MDMFVVPTISFGLLNGLVILRQSRRELLWLMRNARQPTEACGWDEPPRYLIRDRGGAYGAAFIRRIRAMGIRDRPKVGRFGPSCLWAPPAAKPCNFPCNSPRNKTENRAARYLQGRFFGQLSGTDANKFLTLFQMLALEKSQGWPDRAIGS
jgi:hypothetical protein